MGQPIKKYPTPEVEGWWWAKLRLADNPDDNSPDWEVVYVFDNVQRPWCQADIENEDCMLVSVSGITDGQKLDAFIWGPKIERPEELS